jgi:hypothetical protein
MFIWSKEGGFATCRTAVIAYAAGARVCAIEEIPAAGSATFGVIKRALTGACFRRVRRNFILRRHRNPLAGLSEQREAGFVGDHTFLYQRCPETRVFMGQGAGLG